MKFFASALALVAVLPAVLGQNLMVNSPPNVVQCEPTQLAWTGGSAPYYLSLIPAGQPSAPAIKEFPTQQGNSVTWIVDLGSGTSFTIELKDSTGAVAYSAIVTVNPSSDNSCVNASVTETGSSGASATVASSGSQSAQTASTTAASSSNAASGSSAATNSAKSASNSAQSAASTGHSNSNSATRSSTVGTFGIAGLMGLLGAALF
ncbi:hypothetical protein OBBRIDRAFT_747810 [Obba rivulosa]|uniref:Ser-Thr-rich glycosyl-phosphatidyl-inositol-anchored membrane family-domain-containing protein n=1 Tax=Obba rivulosa TaxID=1052685 RepID=A0A8E2DRC6_9APHY|nr:hypothetical protein OBBRIDRAFT_747810 [Obba rivulosa]